MEKLLLFLLSAAGATLIITLSSIFEPFRKKFHLDSPQRETALESGTERGTRKERIQLFFKELFHCPMCLGFWVGIFMYSIIYLSINPIMMFVYGCASSVVSIITYRLMR